MDVPYVINLCVVCLEFQKYHPKIMDEECLLLVYHINHISSSWLPLLQ